MTSLSGTVSGPVSLPGSNALPAAGSPVANLIVNSLIAVATFSGGFVMIEPAPYEALLGLMLGIGLLSGMRIPRDVAPLLFFFTLFIFGGVISSFMIDDYMRGLLYMPVSYFLGLTSVFFAMLFLGDMGRLRLVFRAYVLGAVATTLLGLLGYFDVPGFEIFTRYQRAMGAFKDPNVYAPFLAAPILYLIYGIVNRSPTFLPFRAGALMILLLGLFLAFSRAAWGLAVISAFMFYLLLIINEQKAQVRLKYIVIGALGIAGVALLLLIALQFDEVYRLFEVRAKAVQEYDGGRLGRFARHALGFQLALTKPFGIAPLEFGYIFAEDEHNIYLKSLTAYGWIGFVSWVTITLWTIIGGFKLLFRQRPWLPYLQIAYVVFVGHVIVGYVIDIDRWRHYYLMIGIIWGCMALERRWQQSRAASASSENGSQTATDHGPAHAAQRTSLLEN